MNGGENMKLSLEMIELHEDANIKADKCNKTYNEDLIE